MKKLLKPLISLILLITICFNMVSCHLLLIGVGVGVLGTQLFYDDMENWWEESEGDVSAWWDSTSKTINEALLEAKEAGVDIYEVASQKIKESGEFLASKSQEIVDSVVTEVAMVVKNNEMKRFEGSIPQNCTQSFSNTNGTSFEEDYYDYDEAAFAYNLVAATIPSEYEIFPAEVCKLDGTAVNGIAYTDFKKVATIDNVNYYSTGFIALPGELPISEEDLNAGLEMRRNDSYEDSKYAFFLGFVPEAFQAHCIALGKYFIFGVNDLGVIEYSCVDYDKNVTETRSDLGELYSFDTNKVEKYNEAYSHFTSSDFMATLRSASRSIDEIKADMYASLEDFKFDISSIDIEGALSTAKDSIIKFTTDPALRNRIMNMTLNDFVGVNLFTSEIPESATEREKWVVGTSVVIVIVTTAVITGYIKHSDPVKAAKLAPKMAAICGMAVEAFQQVVLESTSVKDIDGRKLAITAVGYAISANANIFGDALVDGLIDGAFALLDGESLENVVEAVYTGALMGLAMGLTFNMAGKIVGTVSSKISTKLVKKTSEVLEDTISLNGKTAKVVSASVDDRAAYITKKATKKCATGKAAYAYADQFLSNLPKLDSYYRYVDEYGNYINSKTINGFIELADDAPDYVKRGWVLPDGTQIKRIKISNASVAFDEVARESIFPVGGLTNSRSKNFRNANMGMKQKWIDEGIPEWAKSDVDGYLKNNNMTLYDMDHVDFEALRVKWGLTWHETVDGRCNLVPQVINNPADGGIGHAGAISIFVKAQSFNIDPDRLFSYVNKYRFVQ